MADHGPPGLPAGRSGPRTRYGLARQRCLRANFLSDQGGDSPGAYRCGYSCGSAHRGSAGRCRLWGPTPVPGWPGDSRTPLSGRRSLLYSLPPGPGCGRGLRRTTSPAVPGPGETQTGPPSGGPDTQSRGQRSPGRTAPRCLASYYLAGREQGQSDQGVHSSAGLPGWP